MNWTDIRLSQARQEEENKYLNTLSQTVYKTEEGDLNGINSTTEAIESSSNLPKS